MATLTVYPDASPGATTVDGLAGADIFDSTWANLITSSGNYANDSDLTINVVIGSADLWWYLHRVIFLFDTSSIGNGSTISIATLSVFGINKTDGLAITPNIDIYTSAPASNTVLASADFASFGIISQTGSPITYANFSIVGYNDFTFNATGISNIDKTGISKFGARNANYDVSGIEPSLSSFVESSIQFASADNGTNQPKLVVTYVAGGGISVGWLVA